MWLRLADSHFLRRAFDINVVEVSHFFRRAFDIDVVEVGG